MKRRVLVVDDDAAILEVLEMRLATMGFDVTATTEAAGALEASDSGRFDLALLDLRMEPVDGIRLMEALHARQKAHSFEVWDRDELAGGLYGVQRAGLFAALVVMGAFLEV